MSRQAHAQRALERALEEKFPERYRFDQPFLPREVEVRGHDECTFHGSWVGTYVQASVTKAGEGEFHVIFSFGSSYEFVSVNLNLPPKKEAA